MIPVTQERLERARRRLCRHVAAVIVNAMGEVDCDVETIDARCGWRPGTTKRFLGRLIAGKPRGLNAIADVSTALGCELHLTLRRIEREAETGDGDD